MAAWSCSCKSSPSPSGNVVAAAVAAVVVEERTSALLGSLLAWARSVLPLVLVVVVVEVEEEEEEEEEEVEGGREGCRSLGALLKTRAISSSSLRSSSISIALAGWLAWGWW